MNTANLQLEGLLLAMASLVGALKRQNVLDSETVDAALQHALRRAEAEFHDRSELSPANRSAALFPIRFLAEANRAGNDELSFQAIATAVGERDRHRS
jgi:hypothetical protein